MKTDKQFVNTLEKIICEREEMGKLISDCAQYEVRNIAKIILWALFIDGFHKVNHIISTKVSKNC